MPLAQQAQHDTPPKDQPKDRSTSAAMDAILPASVTSLTSAASGDAVPIARRPTSKSSLTSVDAKSDYMHGMQLSSKDKEKTGNYALQTSGLLSTNSGIFIERGSKQQLHGAATVPTGGVEPTGARRAGVL